MNASLATDVDELQIALVQLKLQGTACRLATRAEFGADWKWRKHDRVIIYAELVKNGSAFMSTIETGYLTPDGRIGRFGSNDDVLVAACMRLIGLEAMWFSSGGGI